MGKSNGHNGNDGHAPLDTVEGLRASVTALAMRARELEAQRAEIGTRLEKLIADRPALAARAHVHGDEAARAELKVLNARVLDLEGISLGYDAELAKVSAEVRGAKAALLEVERSRRLCQAEAEAAAFAEQVGQGLTMAAQRWAEFVAARQAVRAAQAERVARLKVITVCLNEMGGPPDGHAWPASESLGTVDAKFRKLTAELL